MAHTRTPLVLGLVAIVFVFGMSMDYHHVFILSRIRELRSRGASTPDAVTGALPTGPLHDRVVFSARSAESATR